MALLIRITCAADGCGQPVTTGKVSKDGRKVDGYVHVAEKQGMAKTHTVTAVNSTVLTRSL